MDIGVIGLGKLGLPLAALYAKNGHKVYGYDKDIKIVEAVNKKISPYPEPYLQDLLVEAKSNLIAYLPYEMAEHLDLFFVVVPTPSWRDGAFSNRYIIEYCTAASNVPNSRGEKRRDASVKSIRPLAATTTASA